jgi:hypothetical protein
MPTIIMVRAGKEVGRIVGSKTYTVLKEQIEACVKGDTKNPVVLREQLQSALQMCDVETVQDLIKQGVDIKTPFENQLTPLMMPVIFGAQNDGDKAVQIITLLLDAGAEWDSKSMVPDQEITLVDFLKMTKKNFEKMMSNYDVMISGLQKRAEKKK